MNAQSFEDLQFQYNDLWKAICQADPATRRVLMAELAMLLARWESEQSDALGKIQALTRSGHWKALAATCVDQCEALAQQLGANKATLASQLETLQRRLDESQQHQTGLEREIKQMGTAVEIAELTLESLLEQENGRKAQLDALRNIASIQAEIDQAKTSMADIEDSLKQGRDTAEALRTLNRLFAVRGQLLAYYQTYANADREIQQNLSALTRSAPDIHAASECLERLVNIGRELKDIDQVLARQCALQDLADEETERRLNDHYA
jgi:phage shock protein A